MKKQRFQWMMAAILTICGATTALTSCTDNDDTPTPTTTGVEQEENLTEDAVSVTIGKTYMLYGEFDEEFGHALERRLKGTMTPYMMADVFVVDPSAVNQSGVMTIEELKTLIRRTESGEASLVLTKATFREFYDWAQIYVMGYLLLELENFYGNPSYDSPEAAPARRKMANIMRNAYMAVPATILYDRGTEASSNGTTISGNIGSGKNVALYGRTLWKDGNWNTLCLPFDVDGFTGTPLEGATVKTLTSTDFANGTLTLNFSDGLTGTAAGEPYIVKWASGSNIANPVFRGVTIDASAPTAVTSEDDAVSFVGSYNPVSIAGEDRSILFLGTANTLYYPNAAMQIGSYRAHFGCTASRRATPAQVCGHLC